jgi:hypothetical protein
MALRQDRGFIVAGSCRTISPNPGEARTS